MVDAQIIRYNKKFTLKGKEKKNNDERMVGRVPSLGDVVCGDNFCGTTHDVEHGWE